MIKGGLLKYVKIQSSELSRCDYFLPSTLVFLVSLVENDDEIKQRTCMFLFELLFL